MALAVCIGELGTAAQVNGAGDLPIRGLDHRRTVAVAIECEHPRSRGIINDRVGPFAGRNASESLQRLRIEDANG